MTVSSDTLGNAWLPVLCELRLHPVMLMWAGNAFLSQCIDFSVDAVESARCCDGSHPVVLVYDARALLESTEHSSTRQRRYEMTISVPGWDMSL